MRQLTLRLPDQSHRNLRLIAAAKEKTMTDLIIAWIQREAETLSTDPLLRALQSDAGLPTRDFTPEDVAGFLRADDETPDGLKTWTRQKAARKNRR